MLVKNFITRSSLELLLYVFCGTTSSSDSLLDESLLSIGYGRFGSRLGQGRTGAFGSVGDSLGTDKGATRGRRRACRVTSLVDLFLPLETQERLLWTLSLFSG